MKYRVIYEHEVVITYEAIVEADTEEQAKEMIENGEIMEEHEMDHQGMEIRVQDIQEDY